MTQFTSPTSGFYICHHCPTRWPLLMDASFCLHISVSTHITFLDAYLVLP